MAGLFAPYDTVVVAAHTTRVNAGMGKRLTEFKGPGVVRKMAGFAHIRARNMVN